MFNFLRKYQTVLQRGWTISHSHQQKRRVLILPHSCRHLLLSVFILATLANIKWHFIVLLHCISLMTNNVEYLFVYLLDIYISSLENYAEALHIFDLVICLLIIELWEFYMVYIFRTQVSCQRYNLKIFCHIIWVVCSISFWCRLMHKSSSFWWSFFALSLKHKRSLSNLSDSDLLLCFFPKSFIVEALTMKLMILLS